MKKIILSLFIAMFALTVNTFAQTTNIGGTITMDSTLTLAKSPYLVTSSLTISQGSTLTIETGVEVKFASNTNIKVLGTLNATGTTFTSNQTTQAAGDWLGISGGNTSSVVPTITLTDCQIQYATDGIYLNEGNANVTISNTSITNCSQYGIEGGNIYLDRQSNVTADGLTISGVGAGFAGIYSIKTRLNITNSSITGGNMAIRMNGVVPVGTTVDQDTSIVTGTTLSTSSGTGLYLENNALIKINGNTFSGNNKPIYYANRAQLLIEGANTYTSNTNNYIELYNNFAVDGDMTLTKAVIPYLAYRLNVLSGQTLTVSEGTVVKYSNYGWLSVTGQLNVNGTSGAPVKFTSFGDDTVIGDTNGDANNSTAANHVWYGVIFESGSSSSSTVNYTNIAWAKYSGTHGAITITNSSPTISNCQLTNSYFGAYYEQAAGGTFSNNTIGSMERTPVAISFDSNPTFTNNTFSSSNNEYDAIGLIGGTMSANGNIIQRDFTDVPNVTYVMLSSITVPNGITLSVQPGVVIKALSGQEIKVEGTLNATGSLNSPIVFTSVNDDNYGNPNDTRNDGNDQIPGIGNFGGFYFTETSTNSVIDSVLVKFANNGSDFDPNVTYTQAYNSAIAISGSNVTINDATITDSNYGIAMRNSTSTLSNTNIVNTTYAPLRLSLSSSPTFTNLTFTSVGWKGIALLDEYVTYNATLGKRNVAGLDNITYIITGLRIENGAQVTFSAGLNFKVTQYTDINVYGGLKVAGTFNEPIIFTALADDNVGASSNPTDNDSEGNGNATDPNTSKWGGIMFQETSDDAFSGIEHAEFWYGGYYNKAPISHYNAAAPVSNVTIKFAYNYGLYMANNSTPVIDSVFIQSASDDPIALSFFANPTFTRMSFDANGSNGLRLIESTLSSNATIRKRDIAGINNIAYIMGSLTINSGGVLTINPGVVIKLPSSQINVYEGAINAVGTEAEPIIFTSTADDSRGGDTNNDGNGSTPATGNWGGIDVRPSSIATTFDYCVFKYGGSAIQSNESDIFQYNTLGQHLVSRNGVMNVSNCDIQLISTGAIGVYGTSTSSFTNNRIQNIPTSAVPVHMSMFANPSFSGNTVENIGYFAIGLRNETFTQNDEFAFRSFAGVDSITYLVDQLTIASGTTITIPPAMVFKKWGSSDAFKVQGNLHVAGTEANPVIFTSLSNDNFGNPRDTENNGAPTSLNPTTYYSWIQFDNISDDASIVEYGLFNDLNKAINLTSASPIIRNNTFENMYYGVEASGISEPTLTDNKFKDLWRAPYITSLVGWPQTLSGNVLEGRTWKGIAVRDETLTQDTTLVRRSFAGMNNVPYIFSNYTIGTGVKLSIDPGLILAFQTVCYNCASNAKLTVNGALEAIGGPDADSTIVFTNLLDDFYGGDTDGGTTEGSVYDGNGIFFNNESSDSESILKYVTIKGSRVSGITLSSASPTIENVKFIDNGYWGIDLTGASNPTISNCDFFGNGDTNGNYGAINNTGSFQVTASNCWFGNNSGPYHETLNPNGTGETIVGDVLFDPWATDNSLNPVTGDISLNGNVTAYDAALGLQAVAALITLNDRQVLAADVSGNDDVSAMDASYILQYAAGLIKWFPAEAENKRSSQSFVSTESSIEVALEDVNLLNAVPTVEIPLTVSNVEALYAFEARLKLTKGLSFVEFRQEGWAETKLISNYIEELGEVRLTFASVDGKTDDTKLGTIVIAIDENTTNSELPIELTKVVGNETNVTEKATSGTIRINANILSADPSNVMKIYPNPVANELNIEPKSKNAYLVQLVDLKGATVYKKWSQGNTSVDIQKLNIENGTYIIRLIDGQFVYEEKVIINQ